MSRNGTRIQLERSFQTAQLMGENVMPILLWLLGIPIPIILLLLLFWH
jgi:hypothetical protein